jgi:hypothetical protein
MALNLIRNSKVFFTTNVNSTTGVIQETTSNGFTATNTFELQVLDGFSFSQNTNNETVTVSEAGVAPVRGQRSFNTSLAPVDWSMSTYIRPAKPGTNVTAEEKVLWNCLFSGQNLGTNWTVTGTTYTAPTWDAATGTLALNGTALGWDFAAGDGVIISGISASGGTTAQQAAAVKAFNGPATVISTTGTSGSGTVITVRPANAQFYVAGATLAWSGSTTFAKSAWAESTTAAYSGTHGSNVNQLQKFGLIVIVDNVTYAIDNCAMNEATIDFGLDGIATVAWTGQATALRQLSTSMTAATTGATTSAIGTGAFTGGGVTGTSNYYPKMTGPAFITNKLSTCSLKTVKALGSATAGQAYYIALTGGSITISNNISYITPAILGVVNQPATYYTGTRSITGTLNAYLNTGAAADTTTFQAGGTGNLLRDMLQASSTVTEPMFEIEIVIGGSGQTTKVEMAMPSVSMTVPSVNTEQVVSAAITFTAAPNVTASSTRGFDLGATNDLVVRYLSGTTNFNAS